MLTFPKSSGPDAAEMLAPAASPPGAPPALPFPTAKVGSGAAAPATSGACTTTQAIQ